MVEQGRARLEVLDLRRAGGRRPRTRWPPATPRHARSGDWSGETYERRREDLRRAAAQKTTRGVAEAPHPGAASDGPERYTPRLTTQASNRAPRLRRPPLPMKLARRLRAFGRRRRTLLTVFGSLITRGGALVLLLAGQRDEFTAACPAPRYGSSPWLCCCRSSRSWLVARRWHLTIEAAGGTVDRRVLYRALQHCGSWAASSLGTSLGLARTDRGGAASSSPDACPQVAPLVAPSFRSLRWRRCWPRWRPFTLVGPLGLPVVAARCPGRDRRGHSHPRAARRFKKAVSCGGASLCSGA